MYFTGITHVTKRITVTVSEADYQILQAIALENDRSIVAQMGRMIRTWSEVTKPTLLPQGNTPKPTKPEPEPAPVLTPEEKEAKRRAELTWVCYRDAAGETYDVQITRGELEDQEAQARLAPRKTLPFIPDYSQEDDDVLPEVKPIEPTPVDDDIDAILDGM